MPLAMDKLDLTVVRINEIELYVFFVSERVSPVCSCCIQLAPENTMMSFKRSVECGAIAFETDVQLRYRLMKS